jgi:hypothetical protein
MTLLNPFPLHGFFQGSHHQMGFLHEFVDQMGPFPWFHGYTPPWRLAWQATLLALAALPFPLLDLFGPAVPQRGKSAYKQAETLAWEVRLSA